MSKGGLITVCGFLLVLMPFLGIPLVFKTALTVLLSALVMFLGILVREERRWLMRAVSGDSEADAYTENGLPAQTGAKEYAKTPEHTS